MKTPNRNLFVAFVCLAFLTYGLFNSAVGPILDELATLTGSSLSAVGGAFTFLFLGSLTTMLLVGPLIDRIGLKIVIVTALVVLAVGISGFSNARLLPLMFAMFLVSGVGQGGMEIAGNLVITEAYPKDNAGIFNLLHFFFGLGAFIGPAVVSLFVSGGLPGRAVHWIAAGVIAILAVLFLVFYRNKKAAPHAALGSDAPLLRAASIYRSPLLWSMGVLLLLYVGVEYSIGSWSTSFMGLSADLPLEQGALVASAYWGFLTLGRLLGIVLSKKVTALQLLGGSVMGALAGGVAFLLLTGTRVPIIVAIMFIGFCFGAIFPTTISITTSAFPNHQGKAVSLVSALSSIGGLTLPWLAGVLLEQGGTSVFSWYVLAVLVFEAVFFLLIWRFEKKHQAQAAA